MDYNQAMNAVHCGKIADVKDLEELRSGLASLHRYYGTCRDASAKAAIESFENEISRRRQQSGAMGLHEEQMWQGKAHHIETMGKLENLKTSVDQLARASCVDKWILIVGAVAAIAGVAGVLLALFLKH